MKKNYFLLYIIFILFNTKSFQQKKLFLDISNKTLNLTENRSFRIDKNQLLCRNDL